MQPIPSPKLRHWNYISIKLIWQSNIQTYKCNHIQHLKRHNINPLDSDLLHTIKSIITCFVRWEDLCLSCCPYIPIQVGTGFEPNIVDCPPCYQIYQWLSQAKKVHSGLWTSLSMDEEWFLAGRRFSKPRSGPGGHASKAFWGTMSYSQLL